MPASATYVPLVAPDPANYRDAVADHSPPVMPVAAKDHSRAGSTLSRAFHDDPLWTALMPDPEMRRAGLAKMFTGLTKTVAAAEGIAETTSRFEAVALWQLPGKEAGLWAMLRSGFALQRFVMSMPARSRGQMLAVLRQLDEHRKRLVPQPHWYLHAIGVEPEQQSRGLGTALIEAGIRRADDGGHPIYLETETQSNVGYYQHLGFEVVEEIVAARVDLPLWLMIRHSRAPG